MKEIIINTNLSGVSFKWSSLKEFRRFNGFTLAEVLITLVIIGVIAAMTIPTAINNMNDKNFKVAYKKAYADINNAYREDISMSLFPERTSVYDHNFADYTWN